MPDMGGYTMDREMQREWGEGSPDDFEFEVLEVLKPDKSPTYDYRDDLKRLAKAWSAKLNSSRG